MIKNIFKSLQETTEILVEKAVEINDVAKEKIHDAKALTKGKVISIIDEWIIILPKFEEAGLNILSFGISMSLNPCMSAEMRGKTSDFDHENIQKLTEKFKNEKTVKLLFSAINTALMMHKKTGLPLQEELFVKLEVKLSPEIKVYIGKPYL